MSVVGAGGGGVGAGGGGGVEDSRGIFIAVLRFQVPSDDVGGG